MTEKVPSDSRVVFTQNQSPLPMTLPGAVRKCNDEESCLFTSYFKIFLTIIAAISEVVRIQGQEFGGQEEAGYNGLRTAVESIGPLFDLASAGVIDFVIHPTRLACGGI